MRIIPLYVEGRLLEFPANEGVDAYSVKEFLRSKNYELRDDFCLIDENGVIMKDLIGNTVNEIRVVSASCVASKFIVHKCKSTEFKIHQDVSLAELVSYYFSVFLRTTSNNYSITITGRLFAKDDKTSLRDIKGRIIWITENRAQFGELPLSSSPENIPEITTTDLHSNYKVLRDRVKKIENVPLMSKAAKDKIFFEKMLLTYPKSQVKYVFPGGDFYICDYDSRETLSSIIESICISLNINSDILKFTIPGINLKEVAKLEIYRTELFPRCTVYVNENPK